MNDQERPSPIEQTALYEQMAQLERELTELKARLPKHSVSAAMMIELEELEEEMEALRAQARHGQD